MEKESIEHLFFGCTTAKYIWSLLAYTFGLSTDQIALINFGLGLKFAFLRVKQFMGLAAVCWAIWRTRNSVCFYEKKVKSPTEIVCLICSFIVYWAGLQKTERVASDPGSRE